MSSSQATEFILQATDTGESFPVSGEMLIGRELECAIVLNSKKVSRYHAKISVERSGVYITDLRSTNGTIVNGKLIRKKTLLRPGDEVAFEDQLFRFTTPINTEIASGDTTQVMFHRQATIAAAPVSASSPGRDVENVSEPKKSEVKKAESVKELSSVKSSMNEPTPINPSLKVAKADEAIAEQIDDLEEFLRLAAIKPGEFKDEYARTHDLPAQPQQPKRSVEKKPASIEAKGPETKGIETKDLEEKDGKDKDRKEQETKGVKQNSSSAEDASDKQDALNNQVAEDLPVEKIKESIPQEVAENPLPEFTPEEIESLQKTGTEDEKQKKPFEKRGVATEGSIDDDDLLNELLGDSPVIDSPTDATPSIEDQVDGENREIKNSPKRNEIPIEPSEVSSAPVAPKPPVGKPKVDPVELRNKMFSEPEPSTKSSKVEESVDIKSQNIAEPNTFFDGFDDILSRDPVDIADKSSERKRQPFTLDMPEVNEIDELLEEPDNSIEKDKKEAESSKPKPNIDKRSPASVHPINVDAKIPKPGAKQNERRSGDRRASGRREFEKPEVHDDVAQSDVTRIHVRPNSERAKVAEQPRPIKQEAEFPPRRDEDVTRVMSVDAMNRVAELSQKVHLNLNIGDGPRLIALTAPIRGKCYSLDTTNQTQSWTIGRNKSADICIANSAISRIHASITKFGPNFQIEESNSANGISINNIRTEKAVLQSGDKIQIGNLEFLFRIDNTAVEHEFQSPVNSSSFLSNLFGIFDREKLIDPRPLIVIATFFALITLIVVLITIWQFS